MSNIISTNQHTTPAVMSHAVFPTVKSSPSAKRLHATLTVAPSKNGRGRRGTGQAYVGRLECAGHSILLEDAVDLGVMAYVMNIGTVAIQLPALGDQASKLYAHQTQMPRDVLALYNSFSKNERQRRKEVAEALFVMRFATGLRVCTQSHKEDPSLVDWYAAERLPQAVEAAPTGLRHNTSLKLGN